MKTSNETYTLRFCLQIPGLIKILIAFSLWAGDTAENFRCTFRKNVLLAFSSHQGAARKYLFKWCSFIAWKSRWSSEGYKLHLYIFIHSLGNMVKIEALFPLWRKHKAGFPVQTSVSRSYTVTRNATATLTSMQLLELYETESEAALLWSQVKGWKV